MDIGGNNQEIGTSSPSPGASETPPVDLNVEQKPKIEPGPAKASETIQPVAEKTVVEAPHEELVGENRVVNIGQMPSTFSPPEVMPDNKTLTMETDQGPTEGQAIDTTHQQALVVKNSKVTSNASASQVFQALARLQKSHQG